MPKRTDGNARDNQLPLFEAPLSDVAPIEMPTEWHIPGLLTRDLDDLEDQDYCAAILSDIVTTYNRLRSKLAHTSERIWMDGVEGLPATMMEQREADLFRARELAIAGISNWSFEDDQAPNETPFYPGAIAASTATQDALKALNQEKEAFKVLVARLRNALDPESRLRGEVAKLLERVMNAPPRIMRSKMVGSLLRDLIHPRLSVRQLQRSIPIVDEHPSTVRWRWMSSPASNQISRSDLLLMLERKGTDHPLGQMDMAKVLQVGDRKFVIRRNQVKDLRIHVRFPKQGNERHSRFQDFKSRLPLFYGQNKDAAQVEPKLVMIPDNAPVFERRKRVDPEPFLHSVPVHRYLGADGLE